MITITNTNQQNEYLIELIEEKIISSLYSDHQTVRTLKQFAQLNISMQIM